MTKPTGRLRLHPCVAEHPDILRLEERWDTIEKVMREADARIARAKEKHAAKMAEWKAVEAECMAEGRIDEVPDEPKLPEVLRPSGVTRHRRLLEQRWDMLDGLRKATREVLRKNADGMEARMAEVELDLISQAACAGGAELDALAKEGALLVETARTVRKASGDPRMTISGNLTPGRLYDISNGRAEAGLIDVDPAVSRDEVRAISYQRKTSTPGQPAANGRIPMTLDDIEVGMEPGRQVRPVEVVGAEPGTSPGIDGVDLQQRPPEGGNRYARGVRA